MVEVLSDDLFHIELFAERVHAETPAPAIVTTPYVISNRIFPGPDPWLLSRPAGHARPLKRLVTDWRSRRGHCVSLVEKSTGDVVEPHRAVPRCAEPGRYACGAERG